MQDTGRGIRGGIKNEGVWLGSFVLRILLETVVVVVTG